MAIGRLIFGLGFMLAGAIAYVAIGGAETQFNEAFANSSLPTGGMGNWLGPMRWIFVAVFGGIGLLAFISGLFGLRTMGQKRQLAKELMVSGLETDGTVTFVDRNYSLLINNRPIYSVVEYKYRDMQGIEHSNRVDNVNTESVIRAGIQVGSAIKVRYLESDPTQSGMVFGQV